MTTPHLDDEQLSLLLDGIDPSGRAHVEDDACEVCGPRLDALRRARDAVASATVPPLPSEVLDRLVANALGAPDVADVADVVPIAVVPSRRRLAAPPPAWLLGAAAAIAALAGVAGLLRTAGVGDDAGSSATLSLDASEESAENAKGAVTADAAVGAGSTAGAPIDPAVVSADLADQDDPNELALTLDGLVTSQTAQATASPFSAARASGGSADADEAGGDDLAATEAAPPSPTTSAPADRARCLAQAEEIGAGRFQALLSTATLRWKGEPAEVLVYRLAEPSADPKLTRQALVLSRPGCVLLADPRF